MYERLAEGLCEMRGLTIYPFSSMSNSSSGAIEVVFGPPPSASLPDGPSRLRTHLVAWLAWLSPAVSGQAWCAYLYIDSRSLKILFARLRQVLYNNFGDNGNRIGLRATDPGRSDCVNLSNVDVINNLMNLDRIITCGGPVVWSGNTNVGSR